MAGTSNLAFSQLLLRVVGRCDGSVGDLIGGVVAGCGEWESGLEQDVGFVPVDVVGDEDFVGSGVEGDFLDEFGALPGARDLNAGAHGAAFDDLDRVDLVDQSWRLVEGAGIDVPGVVFLGRVFEGLQLVAAGVGREGFEVGLLVEEGSDASGGGIDGDAEVGVLDGRSADLEIGGEGLVAGNDVDQLVAHRRHGAGVDEQVIDVGVRLAREQLRRQHVALGVEDRDGFGALRKFSGDWDIAGAFPGERVEDEHGNAVFGAGVDSGLDGLERVVRGFVAGPADAVVVALRFLIDDADAGAGGEVVELVEEHLFPRVGELGGGIVAGPAARRAKNISRC